MDHEECFGIKTAYQDMINTQMFAKLKLLTGENIYIHLQGRFRSGKAAAVLSSNCVSGLFSLRTGAFPKPFSLNIKIFHCQKLKFRKHLIYYTLKQLPPTNSLHTLLLGRFSLLTPKK